MLRTLILTILLATATQAADNMGRWQSTTIIKYAINDDAPKFAKETIRKAASLWNGQSGGLVGFVEAKEKDAAVIVYWDKKRKHIPFNGILGYCNVHRKDGFIYKADISINAFEYKWPHEEYSLLAIVAHEFGHALGLGHAEGESALMCNPQYFGPKKADVDELKALYGVKR